VARNLNWWTRKLHRWGALLTALPLLIVIVSGLLLQVKKQIPWVQPPTIKGTVKNAPGQSWNELLRVATTVKEAEVESWKDIDRIDVRPGKGIAKIQCVNRWELQVDLDSGKLLSSTYRRSDFIESLHDGSFFSDGAKLWVFLPNGIVLFGLWVSGVWLWYIPFAAKRKKRQRRLSE
jgi:uncharacterized iron-regulated membrane protein